MQKLLVNGVDIFNPTNKNLDKFVSAFVRVFGEKYRDKIQKSLEHTTFIYPISNPVFLKQTLEENLAKELKFCKDETQKKQIEKKYEGPLKEVNDFLDKKKEINSKYLSQKENLIKQRLEKIMERNGKTDGDMQFLISKFKDLSLAGQVRFLNSNKPEDEKLEMVKFFNELGYKCNSFEEIKQNLEMYAVLFESQFVYEYEGLKDKKNEEIKQNNVFYKEFMDSLNSLNIINYETWQRTFDEYINGGESLAFQVVEMGNDGKFKSFIAFRNDADNGIHNLIHEMGHAIDTIITQTNDGSYLIKGGTLVDLYTIGENNQSEEETINYLKDGSLSDNEYIIFNEIINDYLAKRVATIFKANNPDFPLNDVYVPTTYAYGFEILDEFIEHHFDKIIELKMEKDPKDAIAYFGKKNLSEIMKIANDYVEKRSAMSQRVGTFEASYKMGSFIREETKKKIEKIDKSIQRKNALLKFFGKGEKASWRKM